MPLKSRRDPIYDLLGPPLILVTPFMSFVNYNDYGFSRTELWLVLGGLIALGLLCGAVMTLGGQWARIILTAGLVTLFVDFQFDWLDKQPEWRVPAFGIVMLLLGWLLRAQLSRITTPRFRNDAGSNLGPSWSFGGLVLWPSWSALGSSADADYGASNRRAFDSRRIHRPGGHSLDPGRGRGPRPASDFFS
jgi:hypothetical protein